MAASSSQQAGGSVYTISVLLGVMVALQLGCCAAKQLDVGGSAGWALKATNYTTWAETYVYDVGDSLFFRYPANAHSVLQVTKADYQNCNTSAIALFSDNKGNTTFPLSMAGRYWFMCGVPNHCLQGMKFTINVTGTSSTPSPSVSPAPGNGSNTSDSSALLSHTGAFMMFVALAASVFLVLF